MIHWEKETRVGNQQCMSILGGVDVMCTVYIHIYMIIHVSIDIQELHRCHLCD